MFVPADKAANSITGVCKRYYLEVICKELGLWLGTTRSDTFLKPWTLKKSAGNHISYMKSLGFKEDNLSDKFASFCWTPVLHKISYKHRLSLYYLTAQQNLCLYSLPISYLPSKGNCQTCHQSYTVAQVPMKCGF